MLSSGLSLRNDIKKVDNQLTNTQLAMTLGLLI